MSAHPSADRQDLKLTNFIAGGGQGGPSGGSDSAASQITAWVEANYAATTIGGATVYDLRS